MTARRRIGDVASSSGLKRYSGLEVREAIDEEVIDRFDVDAVTINIGIH